MDKTINRRKQVPMVQKKKPVEPLAKTIERLKEKKSKLDKELLVAAENGDVKAIRKLILSQGADVNTDIGYYWTPLLKAVENGRTAAVKLLVDLGADVSATEGYHGHTALILAAKEGHTETAKLLISLGMEVDERQKSGVPSGITALMAAAMGGACRNRENVY